MAIPCIHSVIDSAVDSVSASSFLVAAAAASTTGELTAFSTSAHAITTAAASVAADVIQIQ